MGMTLLNADWKHQVCHKSKIFLNLETLTDCRKTVGSPLGQGLVNSCEKVSETTDHHALSPYFGRGCVASNDETKPSAEEAAWQTECGCRSGLQVHLWMKRLLVSIRNCDDVKISINEILKFCIYDLSSEIKFEFCSMNKAQK